MNQDALNYALMALLCLAAAAGFAIAAVGSAMTANYGPAAGCAAFSLVCLIQACREASACRRSY